MTFFLSSICYLSEAVLQGDLVSSLQLSLVLKQLLPEGLLHCNTSWGLLHIFKGISKISVDHLVLAEAIDKFRYICKLLGKNLWYS